MPISWRKLNNHLNASSWRAGSFPQRLERSFRFFQLISDRAEFKYFIKSLNEILLIVLSSLYKFFLRFITFPFRGLKNFFKTILIILILTYIGVTSYASYIVFYDIYLTREKALAIMAQEAKLKTVVVRIVGGSAEGSGFFVAPNEIMTNFHVIDGEPSPKIIFPNGDFITPVKITGEKELDLAILHTEKSYNDMVLSFANDMTLDSEEILVAAGYPLGTDLKGPPTVIRGNYLDYRQIARDETTYIQTDFDLVDGMSGGPLVNSRGEVVGINTLSLGGQSLFISASLAEYHKDFFTDQEIVKLELDPSKSPEDAVTAFYSYLKTRQMQKGFDLLSQSYKKYATYEEWTNRFKDILDVSIISSERYKKTKDTAYVKFSTKNWVDSEAQYNYYQGTWKTVQEEGVYKLSQSNIEEITEPSFEWMMGWQ